LVRDVDLCNLIRVAVFAQSNEIEKYERSLRLDGEVDAEYVNVCGELTNIYVVYDMVLSTMLTYSTV
jgi:hypothetical protein